MLASYQFSYAQQVIQFIITAKVSQSIGPGESLNGLVAGQNETFVFSLNPSFSGVATDTSTAQWHQPNTGTGNLWLSLTSTSLTGSYSPSAAPLARLKVSSTTQAGGLTLEATTNGEVDNIGLIFPNFSPITGISVHGLDYGMNLPFIGLAQNPTGAFLAEVGTYTITTGLVEIISSNGSFTLLQPEVLSISTALVAIPEPNTSAINIGVTALCAVITWRTLRRK